MKSAWIDHTRWMCAPTQFYLLIQALAYRKLNTNTKRTTKAHSTTTYAFFDFSDFSVLFGFCFFLVFYWNASDWNSIGKNTKTIQKHIHNGQWFCLLVIINCCLMIYWLLFWRNFHLTMFLFTLNQNQRSQWFYVPFFSHCLNTFENYICYTTFQNNEYHLNRKVPPDCN